jgi:hypothetical protein
LRHDGQWIDGQHNGIEGMVCVIKTTDGGKTCYSSSDCQGSCRPVYNNSEPANGYREDSGMCTYEIPNLSGNLDSFEGHPIISDTQL